MASAVFFVFNGLGGRRPSRLPEGQVHHSERGSRTIFTTRPPGAHGFGGRRVFVFSPKGIHKEVNKKSVGKPTKTLL
jgi:hypothetical protein